MINWNESMQQTFEFYIVNPLTWKDTTKINKVESCTITWDSTTDTLGSASISTDEIVDECYIRVYLLATQNGVTEKFPLGTFLVQTPTEEFDGKTKNATMDAYTPLLELKEKYPPIGYFAEQGDIILNTICNLTSDYTRAPVIKANIPNEDTAAKKLEQNFISDPNSTWFDFLKDLLTNINSSFTVDALGNISFIYNQEVDVLQPTYIFNDGNSSILYPEIKKKRDIFGIPNSVEVICTTNSGLIFRTVVENNDINSPTSIKKRGRRIEYRDTNPSIIGTATQDVVNKYAETLLKQLSSVECMLTYTHAYCPVRIGDCVMLNYKKAGISNIKAKVISQTIKCVPGCPVTETASYTTKLWRPDHAVE